MNPAKRGELWFLALLFGCMALFLALRLRWFGHLLMWDEAMNLCSTRAFASGGQDAYSSWFWRHPPLLSLILLTVRPLAAGFAARAEWVPVVAGALQLVTLAMLNRRVFGAGPALWSCLAYAVMPGAVFYGMWLNQDCMVAVTGLLALYLCVREKWLLAGLALGFCFLSKEMAIFYAAAVALVLVSEQRFRALAIVAAVAVLTSIWWYAFFSTTVLHFLQLAGGTESDTGTLWMRPWYYYGLCLVRDIGWIGLLLVLAGLLALLRSRGRRLWPAAMFAVTFLVISLARGKTPWYVISLFPAAATLQGVAACEVWRRLRARFPAAMPGAAVPASATLALAAALAWPLVGESYDKAMEAREPGMWQDASASRQAAESLNRLVRDGEKALVTPMFYYEGFKFAAPCPIFVVYLKPMPVVVRPTTITADELVAAVKKFDLDWAMVSPSAGPGETALLDTLAREYGLRPLILDAAYIFRTSTLCERTR